MELNQVELDMICDILNIASIVATLRPCRHEHWSGIPEVDAWCSNCKMDEFEVHDENENLWAEAMNLYFEQV